MRLLPLLVCAPILALDLTNGNAIGAKDQTGVTQTGRPATIHRWFAKDEICDFPKPYVNNIAASTWQTDNVNRWPASSTCPSGSVQVADISYFGDIPANTQRLTDFRNSAAACSVATLPADCRAAGLSTAAALAFGGGTWQAKMSFTATPQGSSSTVTVDARTMLTAAKACAWLSGPAVTQYIAGPYNSDCTWNTSRTYELGFANAYHTKLAASIDASTLTIPVRSAAPFAGWTTPFKVYTSSYDRPERMQICSVSTIANTLTVCSSGRGIDGTTADTHIPNYGNDIWYIEAADLRTTAGDSSNDTTVSVVDASTITPPVILRHGQEAIRVCAKSGNILTVGTAAAPCAAHPDGRRWFGTNKYQGDAGSTVWLTGTPLYANYAWINATDPQHKSIRPAFVLTFWTGWAGVGIQYVYENPWTDRAQDQEFDVTFMKGASDTVVATKTGIRLVAFARGRYPDPTNDAVWKNDRSVWDGTAPGEVLWDFNLPYLRWAGLVPYDSYTPAHASIATEELTTNHATQDGNSPAWDNGSKCALESQNTLTGTGIIFNGPQDRRLPSPGGRRDIALNPGWFVGGLFAMAAASPRWYEWTVGTGYCAAYVPIHMLEHQTTPKYCDKGSSTLETAKACSGGNLTVSAFGYPISRHARPSFQYVAMNSCQCVNTADRIDHIGPATMAGVQLSQSDRMAHWVDMYWIPYQLTGDWFFYWGLIHTAAYAAANSNEYPGCNPTDGNGSTRMSCGHDDWALPGYGDGQRNESWAVRAHIRAAVAGRDGSPEKQLFTKHLNIWAATNEGKYNVTNGAFYVPCPSPLGTNYDYSFWCHGKWFRGNGDANAGATIPGHGPFGTVGDQIYYGADWMTQYGNISMFDGVNQGLTQLLPGLKARTKRVVAFSMMRGNCNPWVVGSYYQPWLGITGLNWNTIGNPIAYPDFPSVCGGFDAPSLALSSFTNDGDLEGGYSRLSRSEAAIAASVGAAVGTNRGTAAFDWIDANIRYRQFDGLTPMWLTSPNSEHQIQNIRAVNVASTTARIRFVRPARATVASYVIGTSRPTATSTAGDTSISLAGGRDVKIDLTGLSPATTYIIRITAGHARGEATLTTLP